MNFPALDVGLGLVFVYLVLALMCTAANEFISGIRRSRAQTLYEGIACMLNPDGASPELVEKFFKHPLIKSLRPEKDGISAKLRKRFGRGARPTDTTPSYIPARIFTAVLKDLLPLAEGEEAGAVKRRKPAAEDSRAIDLIVRKLNGAHDDAAAESPSSESIQKWFDDAMERTSGRYKWKAQKMSLWVAVLITVVANADTIQMIDKLWKNPLLRAAIIEEAKVRAQKPAPLNLEYSNPDDPVPDEPVDVSEATAVSDAEMKLVGQLTGWQSEIEACDKQRAAQAKPGESPKTCFDGDYGGIPRRLALFFSAAPQHLLGWTLTALAVSMGAPFWFDMLNKFIRVRSVGASPEDKQKEKTRVARKKEEDEDA